jgi:hypothetical protein
MLPPARGALSFGLGALLVSTSALAQPMSPPVAPPAPSTALLPPMPAMAPPPGTQWVWVTLPSLDRNARIEAFEGQKSRDEDEDDAWRKLCVEPCAMWIPSGTRLRIDGDFRVSAPFVLPPRPSLRVAVDPARSGLRVTGIVFLPVFGTFAFIGGVLYLASSDVSSSSGGREIRTLAGGFGLFGLAGVATGLALFLTNQRTTVDLLDPNAAPRASLLPRAVPRVAIGKGLWLSPEGIRF